MGDGGGAEGVDGGCEAGGKGSGEWADEES